MTPAELRAWREGLEWSQGFAAALYGVSLRQWQRYESGVSPIPQNLGMLITAGWLELEAAAI
jgi:hypothetical protein